MTSGRIGSLALINDTLRDVTSSQTKISTLQNQISSGYKSKDFAGLNGSVEQFTQLGIQLDRARQFKINNELNISKLQTADAALAKIVDIADQIKNIIVGANGAVIESSNIPQIVGDLLKSFGGELNTSFNGHYIFGGADTIHAPVPQTNMDNVALGVPDDIYYVGAKQDTVLRADERTDVTFPARADDIAFQKIYAAARQAINAAANNDQVSMQAAQQLIQDGQKDLIGVRSRIGSAAANLQSINDRLGALTTYWTQLSDSVSKTDIVAASTEVASYQAILQATFQVYARISQLRLSDYLK